MQPLAGRTFLAAHLAHLLVVAVPLAVAAVVLAGDALRRRRGERAPAPGPGHRGDAELAARAAALAAAVRAGDGWLQLRPQAVAPGPAAAAPGPAAVAPGPAAVAPGPAAVAPGPAAVAPGPPGPDTPPRATLLPLCATAVAGAAAVHATVMPAHFRQDLLYGAFFLLAALGQGAAAVLLLRRSSRPLLVAVAAGSGAVVVLWLVTRVWGLPFGPDVRAGEPVGPLDALATVFEVLAAGLAVLALRSRPAPGRHWSLGARAGLLATVAAVAVLAVSAPKG